MNMILVENLCKRYEKNKIAVDNVSLSVNEGELFGLIGPDGAGKTSIFRMLTTLLVPESGTATVNGFDIVKDYRNIRNITGYMPGKFSLYPDLTIEENLNFFATVFNTTVQENYHLIEDIYVQIEPFKHRRAGKLSGGMKQKLALCCALIHQPKILFLDEPTTGVDPVSRREFWEMLKELKNKGITILVSTPYMDEAGMCDRIALMQSGKILSIDTPEKLTDTYPGILFALKSGNRYQLLKALRSYDQTLNSYASGEYVHTLFRQAGISAQEVKNYLETQGVTDAIVIQVKATIEDCFIQLLRNKTYGDSN